MWPSFAQARHGASTATGRHVVSSPNGTQAVDRAARLLTEVVHAPGAVTFTELAAATGLAKSTTSRLLLALERNGLDRKSTRLNSSHMSISYAVFCLKKKKKREGTWATKTQ